VLVKFTCYGDTNLDGQVDGSDYTLIDNAFNQQGASLTARWPATRPPCKAATTGRAGARAAQRRRSW
jgi:hypothetical protein